MSWGERTSGWVRRVGSWVDARDTLFFVGLGLMAWGLWWIWPPLAPTLCGLVLVVYMMTVGRRG